MTMLQKEFFVTVRDGKIFGRVFEHSAHLANFEQTEEYLKVLGGFLDEVE